MKITSLIIYYNSFNLSLIKLINLKDKSKSLIDITTSNF